MFGSARLICHVWHICTAIDWPQNDILHCVVVCCSVPPFTYDSSVLQRVAMCCSVLQCAAICCGVLCHLFRTSPACCSVLQCVAVCCGVLCHLSRTSPVCYGVLQCGAVCCSVLQLVVVCCVIVPVHLQCDTVCCNVSACVCGYVNTSIYIRTHTHVRKSSSFSSLLLPPLSFSRTLCLSFCLSLCLSLFLSLSLSQSLSICLCLYLFSSPPFPAPPHLSLSRSQTSSTSSSSAIAGDRALWPPAPPGDAGTERPKPGVPGYEVPGVPRIEWLA